MALRFFVLFLIIFIFHQTRCQGPPKITGSYTAWGEIVQPIEGMKAKVQVAFEESYDSSTQNAVFVAWIAGKNVTFLKNYATNQTFRYIADEGCVAATEQEWIQSNYPPGLLRYEDSNGTTKFSLKQLFEIPDDSLNPKVTNVHTTFRGMPARKWMYEIKSAFKYDKSKLSVYAFWSVPAWDTSSTEKQTPLGFIVSNMTKVFYKEVITETTVNVFGFVSGTYERRLFKPWEGVICEGRKQTLSFPNVHNIKALVVHSEMVLPDYQTIKYIDTWFDPTNQLVRIDVERFRDEDPGIERKSKRYESEIAIGKMGIVFKQSVFKGEFKCEVIPFSKYENDMQNFIDVKQDLSKWKTGKLFGLNDTTYVYTGTATKGDIPCHLFQGVRKDWPEASAKIESLWEWCFNVNMTGPDKAIFRDKEIGLLTAQVKILKSDKFEYPQGFRMFHHFYEVSAADPDTMDATQFDISPCYTEDEKRYLQFTVDWEISEDDLILAENLTSDISFLKKWRTAIYENSGLQSYSLRISHLMATVEDKTLFIKFAILKIHPDLPEDMRNKEKQAFQAESELRDNMKQKSVFIMHQIRKEMKTLTAQHLTFQIDPDFKPHVLPPVPPTTMSPSTTLPFSLITEPEDSATTREQTTATDHHGSIITEEPVTTTTAVPGEKEKQIIKKTGHQPGTVAGVSIALLLIGISVGSAGTFYKFNGLPACMRR